MFCPLQIADAVNKVNRKKASPLSMRLKVIPAPLLSVESLGHSRKSAVQYLDAAVVFAHSLDDDFDIPALHELRKLLSPLYQ